MQEGVAERVPAPVPQIMEETVEVVFPHGRVQQRTTEQLVDMPQILKENVDVVRLIPQERVQWPDELMVAVPIPKITEENVDVVRLFPQERVQRIDEQVVEVPTIFAKIITDLTWCRFIVFELI